MFAEVAMMKDKVRKSAQVNKIVNYTHSLPFDKPEEVPQGDPEDWVDAQTADGPSLSDLMDAIKGSWTEMVAKLGSVAINVNLFRTDLRKVADRVKETK
ncbi:hypothetical protein NDU88_000942 [Pleurodeles waltl]|uniref:Uncharacterized protein n=1 Tax=Pleurodeles waltl TaxID=8319 RepID=A0AAV7N9L4_PLEWA|nr:hypothetical protein NDU88_000942 [Pleurodeles waltl]